MTDKTVQAHLRVRLPEADKAFLGALSSKNGGKPNISRAVKLLIQKERTACSVIEILPCTRSKLKRLTELLRRSEAQVIDESIDTVLALMDDDKLPLLVMELRLVKAYGKHRAKKSHPR